MNIRIGPIGQLFAPGYSRCHRCRTPWRFVEPHSTGYGRGGMFPLCEKCWRGLATPDARIPYYRELIREWARNGHSPGDLRAVEEGVIAAVRAGR